MPILWCAAVVNFRAPTHLCVRKLDNLLLCYMFGWLYFNFNYICFLFVCFVVAVVVVFLPVRSSLIIISLNSFQRFIRWVCFLYSGINSFLHKHCVFVCISGIASKQKSWIDSDGMWLLSIWSVHNFQPFLLWTLPLTNAIVLRFARKLLYVVLSLFPSLSMGSWCPCFYRFRSFVSYICWCYLSGTIAEMDFPYWRVWYSSLRVNKCMGWKHSQCSLKLVSVMTKQQQPSTCPA